MDQDAEATHSYVRAAPGRVFARLARRSNDGTLIRGMHVEFTPGQALEMARHLDECARIAIAHEDFPSMSGKMGRVAGVPTKQAIKLDLVRRHGPPSPIGPGRISPQP